MNEQFAFAKRIESGAAGHSLQNASANGARKLRTRFGARRCSAALSVGIILVSALSLSAQEIPEVAPRAIPIEPVAPTAAGPNDIALFLAGMPVPPDSPLAPLTRDPAWQEHSAYFEKEFSKLRLRQLDKLHAWENIYLPEATQPIPVAFYMFSGPDFLYVDQFFPRASVYILCGKESMGPPLDPLRIANLSGALGNLENAMKSSLSFSFFITKNMKIDLHEQNLNGVLPILYAFIARADKSITSVTFGSLNSSAAFQEDAPGKKGGSIRGARINYTDNQTGDSQTLYYFTTDISDDGIKSNPAFLRFCAGFGTGSSFLKSSSYLMFEAGFVTIRNFILEHSNRIVQDDSGIPLAYFDPARWNLRLFGSYLGPIEIFKQHYQPRLQELFRQANPPPLDFGFGYRWNYRESNLIVAERK